MSIRSSKVLVVLLGSALYWHFVCQVTGVREPWDADAYWRVWYPVSFALAAVAGLFLKDRGWAAGTILTFTQLPIMWVNNGTGHLWALGLLTVCVLAVPVVAISTLTGALASRARSV